MVKTAKTDPNAPSPTQAMVLGDAVMAAYRRGWDGKLPSEVRATPPVLAGGNWNRVGVPEGTVRACQRKMLVKQDEKWWRLTPSGVAAGIADYAARNGGAHPGDVAKREREEQAAKKKAREDKVKYAKRLFRGLHRSRTTEDGKRTIGAAITENGEVKLSLDDLIVLGEGIEKLRPTPALKK